jgi:hypothetical protein
MITFEPGWPSAIAAGITCIVMGGIVLALVLLARNVFWRHR